MVLIYDGDQAGQNAAQRAIPILEKTGLQVKVLRMRDAKDPDEFLKKFGADKFKLLLEDASNRVEYQLNAIRRKYDISEDDQKIKYIQESAQLLSTLGSSVQREVYGHRVAEAGGISYDAMKLEVDKAFKRRLSREKKKQEQQDLSPARTLQPKDRTIRYDKMKSARAEEGVIAMALKEPAMLDLASDLKPEEFSAPVLSKVYAQLVERHRQGLGLSIGALEELSGEETSHIAAIAQQHSGPVSEQAMKDYIHIIHSEYRKSNVSSMDDLMSMRNKLKESKGYKA